MSILDKVIAAVTPPESDHARVEARAKARSLAVSGGWLDMVLDHHVKIEHAFAAVKAATDAVARRAAEKELALWLTGHSLAEETVLYPALALHEEKAHSEMAYVEQSAAKVQTAGLEELEPMSQDYLDKLEHLRGAVAHHVYEEEHARFPALLKLDAATQTRLTMRYGEEIGRYLGASAAGAASGVVVRAAVT